MKVDLIGAECGLRRQSLLLLLALIMKSFISPIFCVMRSLVEEITSGKASVSRTGFRRAPNSRV